jgi:hypothetical protein
VAAGVIPHHTHFHSRTHTHAHMHTYTHTHTHAACPYAHSHALALTLAFKYTLTHAQNSTLRPALAPVPASQDRLVPNPPSHSPTCSSESSPNDLFSPCPPHPKHLPQPESLCTEAPGRPGAHLRLAGTGPAHPERPGIHRRPDRSKLDATGCRLAATWCAGPWNRMARRAAPVRGRRRRRGGLAAAGGVGRPRLGTRLRTPSSPAAGTGGRGAGGGFRCGWAQAGCGGGGGRLLRRGGMRRTGRAGRVRVRLGPLPRRLARLVIAAKARPAGRSIQLLHRCFCIPAVYLPYSPGGARTREIGSRVSGDTGSSPARPAARCSEYAAPDRGTRCRIEAVCAVTA